MNFGHFDTFKSKNLIFNFLIIIVALFIAFSIFKYHRKQIDSLKAQGQSERQRQQALLELGRVETKYLNLKDKINENTVETTISSLGAMAKESVIKIVQITPQQSSASAFYTSYPYELSFMAKNYHSLAVFLSRLENSPQIYIIESLRIGLLSAEDADSQVLSGELKLFTIRATN